VAECLSYCCDEVVCCSVLAHGINLWPISEKVNKDQELFTSIATEVNCDFLKGSKWSRFLDQEFLGV